jgi:1-acyl-sn-glycerol-3-phosphate acyltransferase
MTERLHAVAVTLLLWLYFTLGFLLFSLPFYLAAWLFCRDRQTAFQKLNSRFFRGFFRLVRFLVPRHRWLIDEQIREIRSSIIICNHLSYLDPLILMTLFPCHKTIVKSKFFHIPVFGFFVKTSGYLPATPEGVLSGLLIDQVENLADFLAQGGNIFIFPEGTRSRSGRLGSFNPGAFKLARLCRAPLRVFRICNSDRLYTPGKFVFNTACHNRITLTLLGEIQPNQQLTTAGLEAEARTILAANKCRPGEQIE